jgi:hypothetical protein
METIGTFRYESTRPVWDDAVSYCTIQRWYDIMDLANLENLHSHSVIAPFGIPPTPTAIHLWYKAAQTNLYGIYNRGTLEVTIMARYSLDQAHIDNADLLRLQAHNAAVVNIDDEDSEDEDNEEG